MNDNVNMRLREDRVLLVNVFKILLGFPYTS